jgi:hypothetical protein
MSNTTPQPTQKSTQGPDLKSYMDKKLLCKNFINKSKIKRKKTSDWYFERIRSIYEFGFG